MYQQQTFEVIDLDVIVAHRGSLMLDIDESALSPVACFPFDATMAGGPMRYVVTLRLQQ